MANFMREKRNNLLVVDALNLSFRFRNHGKGFSPFAEKYLATVQSFAQSFNCGKILITADKGSSAYRKEIYPAYKQNRKDKFESQTDEEKFEFEQFFEELELALDLCEQAGIPVARYKGVEADDLAAYVVKHYYLKFDAIYLLSTDADWNSLLAYDGVTRFSYTKKVEYNKDNFEEYHDYPLELATAIKCIQGDAGDNIIGITGVGPKRASALASQYGSVFDLYDAADTLPDKPAYLKNVKAEKEKLLLNIELVDLIEYCETAIGEYLTEYDNLIKERIINAGN